MELFKNGRPVILSGLLLLIIMLTACAKKDAYIPALAKPTITSFTPDNGFAGDSIMITGTNLGGVGIVTFGGVPAASFKVISLTSIKAFVGIGATGFAGVRSAGGRDSITGFTYKGLKPIDGYLYSDSIEAASLIAHWAFNGNDSESIHKVIPILHDAGTVSYITGKIGQAIHLNNNWLTYDATATDAGIPNTVINSNDILQNGFTLSLWAQLPDTILLTNLFQLSVPTIPNYPILGLAYRKHAGNIFDFNGGMGNVNGSDTILTREATFQPAVFKDTVGWAFLTMTYNPLDGSLNYYTNGTLQASIILSYLGNNNPFPVAGTPLLMATPNYATIGTFESALTTPGDVSGTVIPATMNSSLIANIDDIRLFKKTLSARLIKDLYMLGNLGR